MTPSFNPSVTPSPTLAKALDEVRGVIATLSPDDQTRVNYALQALEPVIADELNAVAARYLGKLPVFGAIADPIVRNAIDGALAQGLAELTAAKTQVESAQ